MIRKVGIRVALALLATSLAVPVAHDYQEDRYSSRSLIFALM